MGQIRNFLRVLRNHGHGCLPDTQGWVAFPRSTISAGATICWCSTPGSSPTGNTAVGVGKAVGVGAVVGVGTAVGAGSRGRCRHSRGSGSRGRCGRCRRRTAVGVGTVVGVGSSVGSGVGTSVGGGTGVGSGVGTATWASGTGSGVSSTSITKMVTSILSVPPSPSDTWSRKRCTTTVLQSPVQSWLAGDRSWG